MTQDTHEELDIPDGVGEAKTAVEVLRAWIADSSLHVALAPEVFSHDVSEWGRMLSDIVQHIANAVSLDGQMPREEALKAIQAAVEQGLASASAEAAPTRIGKIKRGTRH